MSPTEQLIPVLKKLRMSGVLQTLDLRARQAADDNLNFEEFLHLLLSDEVERREAKQLQIRLRRAQFEHDKTLDDFDFSFNPKVPKGTVVDLAACTFIERHENVLLIGKSGVGKSHIAQAIGHRACRGGYTSLFVSASKLLSDLRASRADNSYDRRLARYCNPDLLVIDDLGLRPLRQDEPDDLYELIRMRYERGSMIITSNRDVKEWYPLFGDALMASAALDRLLHHAHVIKLEGDSYRNPPRPRSTAAHEEQAVSP
jgi:DNA replication protein DnaC